MITADLLRSAMPSAGARADEYAPHLEAARRRFVGDNWHHVAMWLAQISHESGSLRYVLELASGDAYEGRQSLGNTQPGDGRKFRGRGLLQVTGRDNYTRCGYELNLPLVERPELLEQPEHAAMSAGWVWQSHGLGALCEAPDPVLAVTRRLNGGINGLDDRRERYQVAMTAMKLHHSAPTLTQGSTATQPAAPPPPAAPSPAPDNAPEISMPLPSAAAVSLAAELWRILRPTDKVAAVSGAIEKAAPALLEAAKTAVPSAVNEQQAVEQIKANPQLQAQFRQQAMVRWDDLAPILEFEAKERREAREFTERMTGDGPFWRQIGYGILIAGLSITIIGGIGYIFHQVLFGPADAFSQSTRDGIIQVLINVGVLVVGFYFGSSASNRQKDTTIADQAKR